MKDKNLLIALVFLVMSIIVVTFASAATLTPVILLPANYTNHTGTVAVNCTLSHAAENVTVYTNSSAGTMTSLGALSNVTAAQTSWYGTLTITATNDGANQNLSCYADNGTDQAYSTETGCRDVMLDSTDPVCNVSVEHPTIAYKGNQKIIYYGSDAIEWVSSSLSIDGPGKQSTITQTSQNGPVELGSNDTKYIGTWTLSLTVTDRAGNTCTDSTTFKSYMPDEQGTIVESTSTGKLSGKTLAIIVIVALIGYYFAFGKKK